MVKALIEQVIDVARRQGFERLHEITLQVGEFSGFEPVLIQSAFSEMAADYWKNPVQLNVEIVSLTARCLECGKEFQVDRFHFICPDCGSRLVDVVSGEETRLVSIRAERSCVVEGETS